MNQLILNCEYMKNPVGLDMKHPRFSWEFENETYQLGQQISYRLLVSKTEQDIDHNAGTMWDSGVQTSDESLNIPYNGIPLQSASTYYAKVIIETTHGASYTSNTLTFTMGLLYGEWRDNWIGVSEIERPCVRYRTEIPVTNLLTNAMMFIATPCYNVLTINGVKVGDAVLNNVNTDWAETIPYASYRIDSYLQQGTNAIGLECGQGWHTHKEGKDGHAWGENMFSAQILLEYEGGTRKWIYTNLDEWYFSSHGPIQENSVYNGENYDARNEMDGWDKPGFQMNESWSKVIERDPQPGTIRAQYLEPIRITEYLKPVMIYDVGDGSYTVDFGQNFSGWTRITVQLPAGTKVVMKHGELIFDDHSVDQTTLMSSQATDTYITRNEEKATYEPRFTYHGFRYVQIFGLNHKPDASDVTGCVVRSDIQPIGSFETDNTLLNKLYQNIIWTEKCNQHGIPTDCPQRTERLGWLNDMTPRNECALYNFRLVQLYRKWMQDIRDTQGPSGAIADTAPHIIFGTRPADPVSTSFLLVPWNVYLQYGDTKIIEDNYSPMKQWIQYLKRNSDDYIVRYSQMGDWAAPIGTTDPESVGCGGGGVSTITPSILIGTCFFYYDCVLMAKMAKVCGNETDVVYYTNEAENIKNSILKHYYNKTEKYFASNSQGSNILPLYLNIVPENDRKAVLNHVVKDILSHGTHLTTGNLCTRYAIEVLLQEGETELAYALLNQREYPSWGFMIDEGATTIWERWEKDETGAGVCGKMSHSHPMYGSVGVCFHKYFAGIQPDTTASGYNKIIVKPIIPEKLNYVSAATRTIHGQVQSTWKTSGQTLEWTVKIPFNTTATIYIPKEYTQIDSTYICVKNNIAEYQNDHIISAERIHDTWKLEVKSGEYKFVCRH